MEQARIDFFRIFHAIETSLSVLTIEKSDWVNPLIQAREDLTTAYAYNLMQKLHMYED